MKRVVSNSIVFLLLAVPFAAGQTSVEVGKPAPDFELQDSAGKTHQLSSYRGEKLVVLEFFRSGDW